MFTTGKNIWFGQSWNQYLNENVFDGRTGGGYQRLSCANLPVLDMNFWTTDNILAFFCKGSMLTPLIKYLQDVRQAKN